MTTTYRGYFPDDEVYDPATVAVGDIFFADGQEWVVREVRPHEVEVGCLGCRASGHHGYRVNQDNRVERCDACQVFVSDDEAADFVRHGCT